MVSEMLLGSLFLIGSRIAYILNESNKCNTSHKYVSDNEYLGFTYDNMNLNKTDDTKDKSIDYYNITYNYCSKLNIDELNEYIDYNYDLYEYSYKLNGTSGSNDKHFICKNIAELSRKNKKLYNNRFKRY